MISSNQWELSIDNFFVVYQMHGRFFYNYSDGEDQKMILKLIDDLRRQLELEKPKVWLIYLA